MSNAIRLEGFKELQTKLNGLPKKMEAKLGGLVVTAAKDWEQRAKRAVPVNHGALRQGISSYKSGATSAEVVSAANYSRFVEWGTRKKKRVPADLQAFESSLSYSKTGDYYDFLNSILDWVKSKGIGRTYNVATRRKNRQTKDEYLKIAEAIALSILRNGINPQPFFFIHSEVVKKELLARVQTMLNERN